MELSTLICILVVIFIVSCIFCKKMELFTPNSYTISWQKPIDDGGDSGCCNYEWQVCSDSSCTTIIDEGKINSTSNVISVQTTKLDWNTTYTIKVRASNMFGDGEWVSSVLSTGDGVFSTIRFAEVFDGSGNITTPLSAGLRNISIWSSMTQGSETPNDFNSSALIVVQRGSANVLQQRMNLISSYDNSSKSDIFSGDFASQNLPKFTFEVGDIIFATIMVWDSKGNVITEGSGNMKISQDVPSTVSGITLTYDRAK